MNLFICWQRYPPLPAYPDYDRQNPPQKLDFYVSLINKYNQGTGGSILDIGCGPGKLLNALPAMWARYGMDPAAADVLTGIDTTIECARGSLPEIPFNRSFNVITAFDVLEHVADVNASAQVIDEHLLTNGIFVFVVPVYDGPLGKVVTILDKDETHLHKRDRKFWLNWVNAYFEICSWTGVLRYFLCRRWYIHAVTRAGRQFTPAIAVVARKRSTKQK